jgi:hypothetical protein
MANIANAQFREVGESAGLHPINCRPHDLFAEAFAKEEGGDPAFFVRDFEISVTIHSPKQALWGNGHRSQIHHPTQRWAIKGAVGVGQFEFQHE